jgi:phenylacetate-coenzyme A ligase PaaK-like adenylate-forming protein
MCLLNLESLEDINRLPFTEAKNLEEGIEEFLCVSPGKIPRIVSMFTSGSTGLPKRIGFTGEDIENTVRYFAYGMGQMVAPGDRVLICLPGENEYGVSHLLSLGVKKLGATPITYGNIRDPGDAAFLIADASPSCIVGIPVQILAAAEHCSRVYSENGVKSVLLTTDYASRSLRRRIARSLKCRVLNHYGSTEMGYGGALECEQDGGLHLREMDLYFEVIDVNSGRPTKFGDEGELVFTTLSRQGMPLIRYRTGDFTRILPDKCRCGRVLRRIAAPWRRHRGIICLGGKFITMPELDELMFLNRRIADYSASVTGSGSGRNALELRVWVFDEYLDTVKLRRTLSSALPDDVDIDIEYASDGEMSPGQRGKRLFTGFVGQAESY